MAEFTAVFVKEEDDSVKTVYIKEEDGSVDIKECVEEEDPLSTTSQSTQGR